MKFVKWDNDCWPLKTVEEIIDKVKAYAVLNNLKDICIDEVEDNTANDPGNQRFDIIIICTDDKNNRHMRKLMMLKGEIIDGPAFHKRFDEFYPDKEQGNGNKGLKSQYDFEKSKETISKQLDIIKQRVIELLNENDALKAENQRLLKQLDESKTSSKFDDNYLWNILKKHADHELEVQVYGDWDDPANICLADVDTNEIIIDAELYTLAAREE